MPIEKPSDYEAFKAEVISDLDADDLGVHEVFWHANGRYASLPVSGRLAVAEQVVAELVEEQRVVLVQEPWACADARGLVTDPEGALRAWGTWFPEEPVVWMTPTPATTDPVVPQ